MGIIGGIFKVAGSAVLGIAGVAAAMTKVGIESMGGNGELFENIQDSSFNTIGKIWGKEVDNTPLTDEEKEKYEREKIRHQAEVKRKGANTAKRLADTALRARNKEAYLEAMERYYKFIDESEGLLHEGYSPKAEYEMERLRSMSDYEFERKCENACR